MQHLVSIWNKLKRKFSADTADELEPSKKKQKLHHGIEISNVDPLTTRFPTIFDLNGYFAWRFAWQRMVPKTRLELKLMRFSSAIRAKPNWWKKIEDKTIKNKWIKQAKNQGLSAKEIAYVMEELKHYYMLLVDGQIAPSTADGVFQADSLIPKQLKKELLTCATVLENVPDNKKDWHPGSNNQVLDLVHPSLYCYVKGKTPITDGQKLPWEEFLTTGKPEEADANIEIEPGKSAKYQWLPSEFKINPNGAVTIDSYINNLHPEHHATLYEAIQDIFERFVPLFNKTRTEARERRPNRIDYKNIEYNYTDDILYGPSPVIPPVVGEFVPRPLPTTAVELKGRTVQVIVKMANIVLSPDKPEYEGGVWHVEGMENERIIATGIYYYASENIKQSKLSFRQSIAAPEYFQDDARGVYSVYGLRNEELLVQPVGSVVTKQDRCIVFPNLYQHKVERCNIANVWIL